MDRIEDIPVAYLTNIYDVELPKELKPTSEKVEAFLQMTGGTKAFCPKSGCGGILEHKATQDRAADEGMNIRFICSKCKMVVR